MIARILFSIGLSCSSIAWAQQYVISTFAGGITAPTPAPAVNASVGYSLGVASDRAGNFYFSSGNCVFKVDTGGILTRIAGTGRAGYSGDGGSAVDAQLDRPQGLAVDLAGFVYFADTGNDVVRKVSPNGIITRIAGSLREGFSGDGGPATSAALNVPVAVAVDLSGVVYIANYGDSRIRKVNVAGIISTIAGDGTAGYSGDGGPATSAKLHYPYGLTTDASGNLLVADTYNSRIRKISASGVITTVAGTGTFGFTGDGGQASSAQLGYPYGITLDSLGYVYIADAGVQRIRVINPLGVISTIAGQGTAGIPGDGVAINARLLNPNAVSVDGNRDVYISDYYDNRIRKVSQSSGAITTVAGNGSVNFSGDGGPATGAQLYGPSGLAMDGAGDLFFADALNNRVRKVSPAGIISTVAGNGTEGTAGDGGPAINARLGAEGVAVDSAGNLVVADPLNFRIRKVTPAGIISTIAGTGTQGFSADGVAASSAQLSGPASVAFDGAGNVLFSDSPSNRVRKISAAGVLSTVAGNGTKGFSGDGDVATGAQLDDPRGIAIDGSGNLFIADSGNNRIRKVSAGGIITTFAGTGVRGFSGDGGAAVNARLNGFDQIAFDTAGNLYFSDNNRVRKIFASGLITSIAGTGATGYSGDGRVASAALLNDPGGVAVDRRGNVYVADSGNDAIRLLTPIACSYSLPEDSVEALAVADTASIIVITASTCPWTITNLPGWISVSQNLSIGFLGSAIVALRLSENLGGARSAEITVAGVKMTVHQAAAFVINSGGVVNGAGFTGAVAPGSIASLFGMFSLAEPVNAVSVPVPTSLGGLSFYFGNSPAPLFYANAGQANLQIPWELTGQPTVRAILNGQSSNFQTLTLATYAPGIFLGGGLTQGAVQDMNFRLVDASNAAIAGSTVVQIYCTGLGPVTNRPATGAPAPQDPASETTTQPTVTIGGAAASVLFSGLTPGSVGLYQVNARVPEGSAKGIAVPLSISIGGVASNTVTIAVQ